MTFSAQVDEILKVQSILSMNDEKFSWPPCLLQIVIDFFISNVEDLQRYKIFTALVQSETKTVFFPSQSAHCMAIFRGSLPQCNFPLQKNYSCITFSSNSKHDNKIKVAGVAATHFFSVSSQESLWDVCVAATQNQNFSSTHYHTIARLLYECIEYERKQLNTINST